MTVDCHMICHSRKWRRNSAGNWLLIDPTHHVVHSTGYILPNSTANSHTRHHSCHVKTISTTAEVYITGSICSHLAKSLRTGNTNLRLFLNLESSKVYSLGLLVLCILSLFTLDTESLFIMFGFNTLLCMNIFNFRFCFRRSSRPDKISGYTHKLPVSGAGLINFNRTNINTRYNHTERFLQSFAKVIFYDIVNLCRPAFNLDNRNAVGGGSVGNSVFHITVDRITNLFLEIVKVKCAKSM